jgi:hypothetical protein
MSFHRVHSIESGIGENEMTIMKRQPLRQLAVLLLLAGCSAIAAAETSATPEAAEASTQAEVAVTSYKEAIQSGDCHYGVCQEPDVGAPKVETVVGSDIMPGFNSPALTPTIEEKAGC